VRLWTIELQKLADEAGLVIHVHHSPPGTSKWNKIEHRLAAFWGNLIISPANWSARIIASDKETGKVVWKTNVSFGEAQRRITAAPLRDQILRRVANGALIFVGAGTQTCSGHLAASHGLLWPRVAGLTRNWKESTVLRAGGSRTTHTLKVARRIRTFTTSLLYWFFIYCVCRRDTGRWLKLVVGVFDLPDREVSCDYRKQEHKHRTDDASAGDRKSVTTCLAAIFHSGLLPVSIKKLCLWVFFKAVRGRAGLTNRILLYR
jgi:hypothetical protein